MWPFTSKKCKHQWDKWSNPKSVRCYDPGEEYAHINIPPSTFTITVQTRNCLLCNEYDERQL